MNFNGKEFTIGKINNGENIDIKSRIEALMGNKNNTVNLDEKAKRIQAEKEQKAREEERAKKEMQHQKDVATKQLLDDVFDVVTDVYNKPSVKSTLKTIGKGVLIAGAGWLIYRSIKFIADQ